MEPYAGEALQSATRPPPRQRECISSHARLVAQPGIVASKEATDPGVREPRPQHSVGQPVRDRMTQRAPFNNINFNNISTRKRRRKPSPALASTGVELRPAFLGRAPANSRWRPPRMRRPS